MKLLIQIIALSLPAADLLPVLATIGSALLFVQMSVNKFSDKLVCTFSKKRLGLEDDMWAIE